MKPEVAVVIDVSKSRTVIRQLCDCNATKQHQANGKRYF